MNIALWIVQALQAIGFHIPRREYPNIGLNAFLLVLAAFAAYGRFALAPLA